MTATSPSPPGSAASRWSVLGGILAFSRRRVRAAWLLAPFVTALVTAGLIESVTVDTTSVMATAELLALVVLSVALALAIRRRWRERELYLAWQAWLVAVLLFREIHPPKSSAVVELALLILVWLAARWYFRMASYLADPRTLTCMAVVFATYVLSETMDNRAFAFLPAEDHWERPTEEVLELLGHAGVVVLVATARPDARPARGGWDPPRFEDPDA